MSKQPCRHTTVADRVLFGALALCAAAPICHADPVPNEQWTFVVTPYLWLPSIDGTLKFNVPPGAGGSPDVSADPSNYLENLDIALRLAVEARKGDWSNGIRPHGHCPNRFKLAAKDRLDPHR